MKIVHFAGSLLILLSFSACNNVGNPQSTVASAYQDLMKGDSKAFQETLSGDALATYSIPANEAALKQKLSGLDLQTGDAKEVSSENENGTQWLTTYSVPVSSKGIQVLQATVGCEYTESANCIGGSNPTDGPLGGCSEYSVFCSISAIQF